MNRKDPREQYGWRPSERMIETGKEQACPMCRLPVHPQSGAGINRRWKPIRRRITGNRCGECGGFY